MKFTVRQMTRGDVDAVAEVFAPYGKAREQYVRYFAEHERGERVTLIAESEGRIIGYTNVLWEPDYEPFRASGTPEINDLNVVVECRGRGVGTALIAEAERVAAARGKRVMGIGVGLTPDYAAAQRLYPKLGYVSDGAGTHPTPYGDVTFLTKTLPEGAAETGGEETG